MASWTLILFSAAALVAPASSTSPLQLTVRPTVCFSPCGVQAAAIVERHADNRRLPLVADSARFRRSSTVQLDGAAAPRAHTMLFKNLPDGAYTIEVRLEQTGGRTHVRKTGVDVMGGR